MHPTSATNRTRRTVTSVATTAVLCLAVAGQALAREPVDPATLNPAPPDFFNATCYPSGVQIICDLAFDNVDVFVDEPSGILCGSTEILFSQVRGVVGKRFYNGDGDLVRRHFREYMSGTLTNPDTGRVLTWAQHDTVFHELDTPGDLDSGTIRFTGLIQRIATAAGQTVLVDAGTLLFDEAADELVHASGNHPLDDYFSGSDPAALQPVCDALD